MKDWTPSRDATYWIPPHIDGHYGEAPVDLGEMLLPGWHEFMHYLYLPVRIPGSDEDPDDNTVSQFHIPPALWFLDRAVRVAIEDARKVTEHLEDPYVYVTARRGFATPGNPLNRPGWHCDDFGGTDLNYIWSDVWPTRMLRSHVALTIPTDDAESMVAMAALADSAYDLAERRRERAAVFGLMPPGEPFRDDAVWTDDMPANHLLRLSPYVVHDTPIIPAPGGMRSFFKISVSNHRYNLLGNSHNYDLDYEWEMFDRAEVRNQPGRNGNSDYYTPPLTEERGWKPVGFTTPEDEAVTAGLMKPVEPPPGFQPVQHNPDGTVVGDAIDGYCGFCGHEGHKAKDCRALSKDRT